MLSHTPQGLDQIIATFGSLDDANFESNMIRFFTLPYPLIYDGQPVTRARCHKLLVDNFAAVFNELLCEGLDKLVKHFGGIYNRRSIRGQQSHPSTHSWGIAIDVEPEAYPLGSDKRFPPDVIAIFNRYGFFYGGNFLARKDPMHFQFATNY